ncbi:MAG: phage tail protein [Chitinophaga sp.]|uniref:phage tail protein n=1 Tax=Chitinophaga sp. TaxID=1869181 RepID=UPI0025C2CCCE|nr:phage tail protein [Chitinophaga sp.]MBV8255963.1 phage tail protein [Chitinophaga sp.]
MANYPLPVFHFTVSWGGDNIGFSEVSGLSQELQAIEYRDGLMSGTTLPLKRPGLKKAGNITLKRGIAPTNSDLYNWLNNHGQPNVERRDLIISLLNDEGNPVFVWTISQAWPVKLEGPGLKASGNDIAIESVDLVHEGITLKPA